MNANTGDAVRASDGQPVFLYYDEDGWAYDRSKARRSASAMAQTWAEQHGTGARGLKHKQVNYHQEGWY